MNLNELDVKVWNWIHVTQDRAQCRAFVSSVRNLPVP